MSFMKSKKKKKKPTSVDGVLNVFQKTIADLEEVALANETTANALKETVDDLQYGIAQSESEASRATRISKSMRELLA
jgi:hypothetical protein